MAYSYVGVMPSSFNSRNNTIIHSSEFSELVETILMLGWVECGKWDEFVSSELYDHLSNSDLNAHPAEIDTCIDAIITCSHAMYKQMVRRGVDTCQIDRCSISNGVFTAIYDE
jgi:hypothetical protein